ncbi:MAG TPA: lysophospholipid acyltransferase family protein [Clostridia bacterium]|nr:lysophospholipid acyltransferase family protein [Clostridia bacterium]
MKPRRTPLYSFARVVMALLYPLMFGIRVRGAEHFPKDRNFIVLANHISNWDPVSVAYACKTWEIHFLAKEGLFKNRLLRWLVTKLHAIPVSRQGTNLAAMRTALGVLRDGQVLGIFPEGHRYNTGRVEKIETGVAMLALKSDVPLVPAYIKGKYRLWSGLTVRIGPAMDLSDLREKGQSAEAIEEIKQRIESALIRLQEDSNEKKP